MVDDFPVFVMLQQHDGAGFEKISTYQLYFKLKIFTINKIQI